MISEIVCDNIKKTINGRNVLKGVTFKASSGSVVALLGPNGAGKTTSFSILCGLIKPDSGVVTLNHVDITDFPMYKRARLGIGYLPQESSIFRGLSVEDNIIAVLENQIRNRDQIKDTLNTLLYDLSIEHVRKTAAVSLSGGERRKLEIARALATNPRFILLDEPLAGIDPIAIDEMKVMIAALKNKGIGIVITDHNVRDALPMSDYAYILHDGEILVEGTPCEIINSEIAKNIYLGESFSSYN